MNAVECSLSMGAWMHDSGLSPRDWLRNYLKYDSTPLYFTILYKKYLRIVFNNNLNNLATDFIPRLHQQITKVRNFRSNTPSSDLLSFVLTLSGRLLSLPSDCHLDFLSPELLSLQMVCTWNAESWQLAAGTTQTDSIAGRRGLKEMQAGGAGDIVGGDTAPISLLPLLSSPQHRRRRRHPQNKNIKKTSNPYALGVGQNPLRVSTQTTASGTHPEGSIYLCAFGNLLLLVFVGFLGRRPCLICQYGQQAKMSWRLVVGSDTKRK